MRLYLFGNYYLSSLQQGLQGIHVLGEMLSQTAQGTREHTMMLEWAANHKTVIILNGGNAQTLDQRYEALKIAAAELGWPVAKFYEDEMSLNNALTCVGVVIPATLYDDFTLPAATNLKLTELPTPTDHLTAAFNDDAFSAIERVWLVTANCRLAN